MRLTANVILSVLLILSISACGQSTSIIQENSQQSLSSSSTENQNSTQDSPVEEKNYINSLQSSTSRITSNVAILDELLPLGDISQDVDDKIIAASRELIEISSSELNINVPSSFLETHQRYVNILDGIAKAARPLLDYPNTPDSTIVVSHMELLRLSTELQSATPLLNK